MSTKTVLSLTIVSMKYASLCNPNSPYFDFHLTGTGNVSEILIFFFFPEIKFCLFNGFKFLIIIKNSFSE